MSAIILANHQSYGVRSVKRCVLIPGRDDHEHI
jgi:hypothetical protein